MFQTHCGHHLSLLLVRDSRVFWCTPWPRRARNQVSRDEKTLLEEDLKQLQEIPLALLPLGIPSGKHTKNIKKPLNMAIYPLVMTNIAIENGNL